MRAWCFFVKKKTHLMRICYCTWGGEKSCMVVMRGGGVNPDRAKLGVCGGDEQALLGLGLVQGLFLARGQFRLCVAGVVA